ncbi:MAG TPA: TetR family transcriptional regulator [Pseudonocardiaceae bacterium]|nr:TetR family transcriptional regulator [Pseudonocardiaceae bacterium]
MTRHTVVAQALALADREGLEAVTIRRLADQLVVTPMGMYWHVKDRDELLTAMSEQLLAEVVPAGDPERPWHERLRAMVVALLDVLRAHPCAPAVLGSLDTGSVDTGSVETGSLDTGTADEDAADGFSRVTEAAAELLSRAGFTPLEASLIASQLLHGVMGLMARQPAGDLDAESYFDFGVDLLLSGVEAVAMRRTAADG